MVDCGMTLDLVMRSCEHNSLQVDVYKGKIAYRCVSHGFIDLKISLQFFGMDSTHSSKHSFINDAPGLVRAEQEEDRLDRQGKQKRRGKWLPGTEDWRQGKDKEG